MKLKELIGRIEVDEIIGSTDIDITGISYDSRKICNGNVFICIKGLEVDGHNFIQQAIDKGAIALIVEEQVSVQGVTIIKLNNTRKAMAQLATKYYNNPTNELKLIGLTGTNGKTTTSYLIKSVLEADNRTVGLIGTISTTIGDKNVIASRTTPEAFELQSTFREMLDNNINHTVMEVSSHSLELNRVDGCDFHIGAFTNLTQDHLDFHKTFDNYRNAKKKLFYKTSGYNIINADDYHGRIIIDEIKHQKTKLLTYGIHNDADIMAKNVKFDERGISFTLITPQYEIDLMNRIPGKFSVYNCLVAAAVGFALGINKHVICLGILKLENVAGRSETVNINKPYTVLIDYAHSPDSLENIIKSIRQYAKGRIITLMGCGGNRDKEKRPIMGEVAGNLSNFCIITSDNPRYEEPMNIIYNVESGMKNTNCDYICIENRVDAIKYALTIAKQGDIVLLAGKGHETYQEIKGNKLPFDEREIVQYLIREEI